MGTDFLLGPQPSALSPENSALSPQPQLYIGMVAGFIDKNKAPTGFRKLTNYPKYCTASQNISSKRADVSSALSPQTQLYIGIEAGYIDKDQRNRWTQETRELSKMLYALIKSPEGSDAGIDKTARSLIYGKI